MTGNPLKPALRILSLGAGVQSTALLLLSAEGHIPKYDAAIFADTGWEPQTVYDHLDRLEREVATSAGIPIYRVSGGHIRDDALNPQRRFAAMPTYVKNPDGSFGMTRRQCTAEYKLKPIKAKVRELLGFQHPTPIPKGVYVQQHIGISTDEWHRAHPSDVKYAINVWPLLDLGWSRKNCLQFLTTRGWPETPKSACIGCPYHGNSTWRRMRAHQPAEFADAVAFDHAIRHGSARANATGTPLRGQMFLHRSRLPLDQAPIERVTRHEHQQAQPTILDLLDEQAFADAYLEADIPGCSPFACRADAINLAAA